MRAPRGRHVWTLSQQKQKKNSTLRQCSRAWSHRQPFNFMIKTLANYGRYQRYFFDVSGDIMYGYAITSLMRLTLQGSDSHVLSMSEISCFKWASFRGSRFFSCYHGIRFPRALMWTISSSRNVDLGVLLRFFGFVWNEFKWLQGKTKMENLWWNNILIGWLKSKKLPIKTLKIVIVYRCSIKNKKKLKMFIKNLFFG